MPKSYLKKRHRNKLKKVGFIKLSINDIDVGEFTLKDHEYGLYKVGGNRKPLGKFYQIYIELRVELVYKIRVKGKWQTQITRFTVPKGFVWDGASIPTVFQWLMGSPLDKEYVLASCLHDMAVISNIDHYPESRLFYEVLKTRKGALDLPRWKEILAYKAVYMWSLLT